MKVNQLLVDEITMNISHKCNFKMKEGRRKSTNYMIPLLSSGFFWYNHIFIPYFQSKIVHI